jgi:hypothetical protein
MTTMPAVRTVADLYPEPDPDVRALLDAVAESERDEKGNYILRRDITIPERQILSRRLTALALFVEGGRPSKIGEAVSRMLSGFGSARADVEDAKAITVQYASVLRGLPLWAVERACMKFSTGQVDPADIGAKRIDRAFAPSSAQLRLLADKLARPIYIEASRIGMTLRGNYRPPTMTPEQVAASIPKIKKMQEAFHRGMAAGNVKEAAEKVVLEDRARRESEDRSRKFILAEYSRAGVAPVYADAAKTMLLGLSILLQRGYTIEDVDGEQTLVAPEKIR